MRSGLPAEAILHAIREVLGQALIQCLATVDRRAHEPGLVKAAESLGVPLLTYRPRELSQVPVPNPSARTAEALGTPSVAEAAALLAASAAQLTVAKHAVGGVTIAAAAIHR